MWCANPQKYKKKDLEKVDRSERKNIRELNNCVMKKVMTFPQKRLVVAAFGRKNTRDITCLPKGIQQTNPRQPKETPRNNHVHDLPPTGEYSPIPMCFFVHHFLLNSQFLNGYPRPRNW